MDNVAAFLLWPFRFLVNSAKWLAHRISPIRNEEEADDGDGKADDDCCIDLLGMCGTGVPLGSLYYVPARNTTV